MGFIDVREGIRSYILIFSTFKNMFFFKRFIFIIF